MPGDLLERHRSLRILLTLIIIALGMYIFGIIWSVLVTFADVMLVFMLAWIISFILEPVSLFLRRRGLPRVAAVSLIYFAVLIVVSGAIVLTIPAIGEEVTYLASEITNALSPANLHTLNSNAIAILRRVGFSQHDAKNLVDQVSSQLPDWARGFANDAVNAATMLVTSVLNIVFDASLIVILSFYMMLDGERLLEAVVRRLPPAWIPDMRLFQWNVDQIFGGFFRAQLIIAGIYAALTWLILLLMGQANGLLVALLSGVLMLLPFIGTFLAVVPPALLVALQSPNDGLVLKLVILIFALAAAQHVVLNLLAPRIFGAHMNVPTLILFAALLLGAKEGGVWGAFFAGPVVGVIYAMFAAFYERFAQKSTLFQTRSGERQPGDGHTPPPPDSTDVTREPVAPGPRPTVD